MADGGSEENETDPQTATRRCTWVDSSYSSHGYTLGLPSPLSDHNLWDIIVNGDLQEEPAPTGEHSGPSAPPAPKIAKQLAAKRNQERVKSILLLAIPDEYLFKFHNVPDAKSI
ncbi:hypothetical protein Tco_0969657 [Tanacetum coccineum]